MIKNDRGGGVGGVSGSAEESLTAALNTLVLVLCNSLWLQLVAVISLLAQLAGPLVALLAGRISLNWKPWAPSECLCSYSGQCKQAQRPPRRSWLNPAWKHSSKTFWGQFDKKDYGMMVKYRDSDQGYDFREYKETARWREEAWREKEKSNFCHCRWGFSHPTKK